MRSVVGAGLVPAGHRVRGASARTALVIGLGGRLVVDGTVSVGTVAFFVLTLSNLFEPLSAAVPAVQPAPVGGRRAPQAVRAARHAGRRGRAAGRGRRCPTTASCVVERRVVRLRRATIRSCRDVDLVIAPGETAGARRAHRRRQVDAGQARSPGCTTPPRAGSRSPASTCATPTLRSLRHADHGRAPGGLPLRRHHPGQRPHRPLRRHRRRGRRGALEAVGVLGSGSRPCPRGSTPRSTSAGSRLSAGEKQLVSLARAALADPARARARRGHVEPRPGHRGAGRAGAWTCLMAGPHRRS